MTDNQRAIEITDDNWRQAAERYRREQRFAALVQSAVGFALNKHGRVDPEEADKAAYNIAMDVAAILLSHIYDDDAELKALRAQADRFQKLAEEAIMCSAPPIFLTKTKS